MAKTRTRVFKIIFRVDFPLNFGLLDRIGYFADFIQTFVRREPFKDVTTGVDVVNQSVAGNGKLGDHTFRLNLTLASLDCIVEFTRPGLLLGESIPELLELAELLMASAKIDKFLRIGYRAWILADGPSLKFDGILREMQTSANVVNAALAPMPLCLDVAH